VSRFRLRYRSTDLDLSLGAFLIGRSSRCNLAVADALVSRRHSALHVGPEEVTVEDLDSRNGVVVNGLRIDGPRQLAHMDRIFIGALELLFIDAEQITDRLGGERYLVCNSCGAISGAAKRHCGDCGVRLDPPTGSTEQDRRGLDSDAPAWGEDTRPVRTLEVIGGIAAKAMKMGRLDEAERVLLPHLDNILERGMRQLPLADSDQEDSDLIFEAATVYALKLGRGPRGIKWIDWVFRLHASTGRLMTAETIETLHELVRQHDYHKRRYVQAYLQVVHNQAVGRSPSERFLFGRLEGLTQVVLARATGLGA
jgi:hypothetical protein